MQIFEGSLKADDLLKEIKDEERKKSEEKRIIREVASCPLPPNLPGASTKYQKRGFLTRSGLGNLSFKNRLRDRFFGSKSGQVTRQRLSWPNLRQESRTGF